MVVPGETSNFAISALLLHICVKFHSVLKPLQGRI